jgi:acetolactate synthase-1/2/3 large subunit
MARMTGGEALVDGLLRHGVDTIFGLPGVQLYGLFDALGRNANRIRLINARHEQTTAYMAFGYAQSTGRPGVFTVVPGPGVLNTTAALATAWGVNAPLLCLTGQVPSNFIGQGRGQLHELPDQLATLKTLLKSAERIEAPVDAPYKLAQAFQTMQSGRQSPVALEMASDMFTTVADIEPCDPLPLHPKPTLDTVKLAELVKAINAAKAPMIWVGGGALDASAEITALAERIGAPVGALRTGKGIVSSHHPLSITVPAGAKLWPDCDLVIGIGTRMTTPLASFGAKPPGLTVARIDIDPAEMRRLPVDIGIIGDAAQTAAALTKMVAERHDPAQLAKIAAAKAEIQAAIQVIQPQMSLVEAIRDVLPEDGIFCDEMTQVGYVSWFGMPSYSARSFITSGFSGTLGYGVPTALGVKVAHPDRTVIAVTGDGGFLFGGVELATAVQHGINLVIVVVNNSAYGNVFRDQKRLFDGRHAGSQLVNPDFQMYARSFGVPSWRVTDADGLRGALKQAIAANSPALVEVVTDIDNEPLPFAFLARGRA